MTKIVTAMGNPILNKKLQKLDNISVIGKDIQYQEGVLEILEENIDIDCLIINNNLPGEIDFYKLIKEIKNIKENVDIYVFLQEKNENIENYLTSQNIYKIYYLDEIDFDEFITNFKVSKSNMLNGISKEINDFKKLILNENMKIEDNYSYFKEKITNNLKKKEVEDSLNNLELENDYENNYSKKDEYNNDSCDMDNGCQTIAISGNFGAGKTIISCFLSKVISNHKRKTLLIDFDIGNSSISTLFGIRKYKENQIYIEDYINKIDENLDIMCGIEKVINIKEKNNYYIVKEILERLKKDYEFIIIDVSSRIDFKYVKIVLTYCDKIIYIIEPNLLEVSKANKILEVFLNDFNIDVDKIKIVFNKENQYKIVQSVLEEIFSEFEIIGNIEYEERYNLFINKNTNGEYEEKIYEEIYKKLIMKKEEIYANSVVRNY